MSTEIRLLARDPAAWFLVQAPAGSGKTELLIQRMLKLLTVVDEPEEILALTFTRKAAAEMRGRVLEALAMDKPRDASSHRMETWQLADAANARSRARDWHLEAYPARLRIMTLDSLTHALAGQMPLLSGFGEMPAPCSHPGPLYRDAAETAVNALIRRARDQAGALLLHQDNNTVALIKLLGDMLGKRDQWLMDVARHTPDTGELRKLLENSLRDIMHKQLQQCDALIPAQAKNELPALIACAASQRGDEELVDLKAWPASNLAELETWQRLARELMANGRFRKPGGINIKRGFPPGEEYAASKKQFQDWLARLAGHPGLEEALAALIRLPSAPYFDDSQWQVLEALFALLLMADAQLQRLFAQRGEADFIEIALRAMRALEDDEGRPSDLLLKLDYRIRHILVDEFQDTSLLQLRLLQSLTAGWQTGDGVDRSLFMVGDPMQSIYRFRKAEVGLFLLAALNRAGLPPLEKLTLERNFRSAPAIVAWVNCAFADIFPDEADIMQGAIEYAPATAALGYPGTVRLYVQRQADEQQEAEAVLSAVREQLQLVSPSGEPRRMAILARSRKHLHAIMPALAGAGVAFRAIDILPLNKRPEIRQMRAFLRSLLHPVDRESWAALLRGPCCGLSTREMHVLLAGDARPVATILDDEARLAAFDAQTRRRICHLQAALAPCLRMAGRIAVRHLLESAWQRSGMAALMTDDAARNIDALLILVEELDEGGYIAFNLLDERLEKLYAAPDSSPEAARVELLTMHGAKGLQWDVVMLPGLGRKQANTDMPLLAFADIPVPGGAHPLMAVRAAVRSSDAIYDMIQNVEKRRENNELTRLLYVSCTRAESTLLMFGCVLEKNGHAIAGSLLELLLPDGIEGDAFGAEVTELNADRSETTGRRHVLMRIRELPELVEILPEASESITEYFWAGPEAAPIGNAMHAALQQVAERGVESWNEELTDQSIGLMRRMLLAEGLPDALIKEALERCEKGLRNAINSEKGQWLLSGAHRDAHCEWALSEKDGDVVSHHIMDRSFVDADGTRWIIDYKTATHEGGNIKHFLDEEQQRHAPQLQRYARALLRMEPERPIRMALYFPLLDAWREWNNDCE